MKTTVLVVTTVLTLVLVACGKQPAAERATDIAAEPAAAAGDVQQYTCSMHPHYISTDPDGTCPICGMKLVPMARGAGAAANDGAVAVAAEMMQTMGVRTVPATMDSFGRTVRAFGAVQSDERLEHTAVARFEGWIESLAVRAVGDPVAAGTLLYRIYSPELIAAQKDYLNALEVNNPQRIAAVKQRLVSRGMQGSAVNVLMKTRQVIERVPVYAEVAGTVAELSVREGDYVRPGTPILRLQSYSRVWVIASIPEQDVALIRAGMPVRLSIPSAPDAPADGTVDFVYPTIDQRTRTADVRIVVPNNNGQLRPGAYADVSIALDTAPRLSVPTAAILRDSRGAHVIVALGEGRFAAKSVRTGLTASGRTEIVGSLAPGEQVVANGQFLLDSEVNLRSGLMPLQDTITADTPLSQLPMDTTTVAQIDHFTDMALYFHEALTDGYRIEPSFVDPAIALGDQLARRFANSRLAAVIEASQVALREAKDATTGAPLAAQLARLMVALEPWLLEGAPQHYQQAGVSLFRDRESGQLWLQKTSTPNNPYGAGAAELIDWPAPTAAQSATTESAATNDPHVGHRH